MIQSWEGMKQKLIKILKILKSRRFLTVFAIVAIIILGYIFKSLLIAAVVNGRPIFRYSLTRELERVGGKGTLESMIEQSLVYSEAQKLKKLATAEEINTALSSIEDSLKSQGLTLDQALSIRGQAKPELLGQIKLQKTVEKLLGDKITISDKEISDYFTQNKGLFTKTDTLDKVKDTIKSTLFQQKLSSEYQTLLTDLKAKAKILYFVNF